MIKDALKGLAAILVGGTVAGLLSIYGIIAFGISNPVVALAISGASTTLGALFAMWVVIKYDL